MVSSFLSVKSLNLRRKYGVGSGLRQRAEPLNRTQGHGLIKRAVSEYEEMRSKNVAENKAMLAKLMRGVKEVVGMPVAPHNTKAVSEYEEIRLKNIEDNKAVLAKLMQDVKQFVGSPITPRNTAKRRSPVERCSLPARRNPSRGCRPSSQNDSLSSDVDADSSSSGSVNQHLVVKFGSFVKLKRQLDGCTTDDDYDGDESDDEENHQPRRKRRRRLGTWNAVPRRDISTVTDDDLKRIATFVSEKRYSSAYGTTCHQCRQKTDDMKTICTSADCAGVRGQFCGPCLRNRYGEDAKEALRNTEWVCPPCRGICNCSFCRRDAGKSCTGILIHLAREYGFSDVNGYLQSLRKK